MVEYHLKRIKKMFCKFDRFSKFVLIGNNIDGYVNVNIVEFKDYEEVKKNLPRIFDKLIYEGEWAIHLYQVPEEWRINYKYGYYRVPSRGKLVFEFSYMHSNIKNHIFLSNTLIHIFTLDQYFNYYSKETYGEQKLYPLNVTEICITVELIEDIDGRKIKYEEFNGKIEEFFRNSG